MEVEAASKIFYCLLSHTQTHTHTHTHTRENANTPVNFKVPDALIILVYRHLN